MGSELGYDSITLTYGSNTGTVTLTLNDCRPPGGSDLNLMPAAERGKNDPAREGKPA
jgi:hypothetical protein